MYTVSKWILVGMFLGPANGVATAAEGPHTITAAADGICKAPRQCIPVVKASPERRPENDDAPGPRRGLQGPPKSPFPANVPGTTHSTGKANGVGHPKPGPFACGEVVSGYTVTCTNKPPRTPVSAPEMDITGAVGGMMIVLGCLAILRGRPRRIVSAENQPIRADFLD